MLYNIAVKKEFYTYPYLPIYKEFVRIFHQSIDPVQMRACDYAVWLQDEHYKIGSVNYCAGRSNQNSLSGFFL